MEGYVLRLMDIVGMYQKVLPQDEMVNLDRIIRQQNMDVPDQFLQSYLGCSDEYRNRVCLMWNAYLSDDTDNAER